MCGSDTPFDCAQGRLCPTSLTWTWDFDSGKRTIGKRSQETQAQQHARVESLAGTGRRAASFAGPDFFDSRSRTRSRFFSGVALYKPLFQIFSRSRREA